MAHTAPSASPSSYQPSDRGRMWLIIAIVLGLIGLGLSAYSLQHHLAAKAAGKTDAACNINSTLSCDAAALSQFSEISGVPLGVFGGGYFLAMMILAGLGLAGVKTAREHVQGYIALVGIGVLTSIVLAGISVVKLGSACPTCIGIYLVTLLQATVLWVYRAEAPWPLVPKQVGSGGFSAAIIVALAVIAYSYYPREPSTKIHLDLPQDEHGSNHAANNLPTLSTKAENIPIARSAYSGLGEDYRKGPDNAPVVIVEFADFQCPACKGASTMLEQIHREYPEKVQIVFRNYPLNADCNSSVQSRMHEFACKAALLGRCAGQFGKFWQWHDTAFANQETMNETNIKNWAKQIGLSDEQVNSCLQSQDMLAKIKDDITVGNQLNVDSTPSLYINGRKILGGRDLQTLKNEIDKLL